MDAVAPSRLKLDVLDRAELLLVLERHAPRLRQSDLWDARWQVAQKRSRETFQRETDAGSAYFACFQAQMQACVAGKNASTADLKKRARLLMAKESASLAHRRAEAAEQRAWRALQASWST